MDNSMKLGGLGGLVLLCLIGGCGTFGCETVEPGMVGIKVNFWGSNRGVDDYKITTGRVIYNRFTEKVYEFPTYMQNVVWTKDVNEGSPTDEAISFNSVEGESLNADVALSYAFKDERITNIFVGLRQDASYIKHNYMRSKVRDALTRHAGKYKAIEIIGSKRDVLLKETLLDLESELGDDFTFDMLAFVGEIRVSARVKDAISLTIESSQKAIEAENKVKQITAEAQQAVEKAKGLAEAKMLQAKAEADANEILTKSLSPTLLQYEMIKLWDGKLPNTLLLGEKSLLPTLDLAEQNK